MLVITQVSTIKLLALACRQAGAVAPVVGSMQLNALADKLTDIADDKDPYTTYRIIAGSVEAVTDIQDPIIYDNENYPRVPVLWTVKVYRNMEAFNAGRTEKVFANNSLYRLYRDIFSQGQPRGLFEFAAYQRIADRAIFLWHDQIWTIELEEVPA